jgi:hypothetical protein
MVAPFVNAKTRNVLVRVAAIDSSTAGCRTWPLTVQYPTGFPSEAIAIAIAAAVQPSARKIVRKPDQGIRRKNPVSHGRLLVVKARVGFCGVSLIKCWDSAGSVVLPMMGSGREQMKRKSKEN